MSDYQLNPTYNPDFTVVLRCFVLQVYRFLSSKTSYKSFPACTVFSGEVEEIGPSVTRFDVGDNVCGIISPFSKSSACADECDVNELDIGWYYSMLHCVKSLLLSFYLAPNSN